MAIEWRATQEQPFGSLFRFLLTKTAPVLGNADSTERPASIGQPADHRGHCQVTARVTSAPFLRPEVDAAMWVKIWGTARLWTPQAA